MTCAIRAGIRIQPDRFLGYVRLETVPCGRDGRRGRLDRRRDEAVQRDDLAAEVDLAARDPRDIEEVVDQPCHVIDLPLDDGDRATGLLAEALALEQRERVPDWCKRVAQLVGEDRDEIVLAVVGVSQGLFGTPAIGNVGADARA